MNNWITIFNLEDLTSIKIRDKRKNVRYAYVAEHISGILWWRTQIEAYFYEFVHDWHHEFPKSREDLLKAGYQVNDDTHVVYYKPYVTLKFSNGEEYTKEFEVYQEALEWGTEQSKVISKPLIIDCIV